MWRFVATNEIYDQAAVRNATKQRNASHVRTTQEARAKNAQQQQRTAQKAEQSKRRGKHMRARCNDTLLQPGFDLSVVKPHYAGTLYEGDDKKEHECDLCGAKLFRGEVVCHVLTRRVHTDDRRKLVLW